MAYQYQQGLALDTGDLLLQLKAFMVTTCGWTMVDDQSSTGAVGQYFVVSSTGESGTERVFLRFHRLNANGITVYSYLSWNAGTHVGVKAAASTSATTGIGTYIAADDNGYVQFWFFGSLDRLIAVTRSNIRAGVTDTIYAGLYTRQRSSAFRSTTGALAAGTNVVVALADTSIFTVGSRYVIVDDTNLEYPKVTAINPNVSITLDRLQAAYASGARIGADPRPVLVTASGSGLGLAVGAHWLQASPYLKNIFSSAASIVVRTVDPTLIERTSPDGGPDSAAQQYNLWPLFIADEAHMDGALLGQMTEAYITSRDGIATDNTITDASGHVYHYINTAAMISASGSTAVGLAVRRS